MKPDVQLTVDLQSRRARKARLAHLMKRGGYLLAFTSSLLLATASGYLILIVKSETGYIVLSLALFIGLWAIWYKSELQKLAPAATQGFDAVLDQTILAKLTHPVTPKSSWSALENHWQEVFITNRLLLDPSIVKDLLPDTSEAMQTVWELVQKLHPNRSEILQAGTLTTALILSSPELIDLLSKKKIKPENVLQCQDWLMRLVKRQNQPKPYFGGIGRDWAFGFTPNLERYTTNISLQIQSAKGGLQFSGRGDAVQTIINGLDQANAVAIVGDTGIGKSSVVYALAQRLLEGNGPASLKDHQVVSLNASLILSQAQQNLEHTMLVLFSEAIRAGNMVLFLDEAQLFFHEGRGAFDMSQIILPVLQNRRLKLITSFNSTDFQRLKNKNPSLAAALMPFMLQEPSEPNTLQIIEDSALDIEYRTKRIVSFEATREAYRLSNQYIHDKAFPGKAIALLEQASAYADQNVITAASVQQTIEATLGVKAVTANATEAASLLQLEDKIHERMINQKVAVSAVASALRRSRAGVGNSTRPIGSFLFLGPTGVGKTELARSLAAVYFGNEQNMVRLDMSEYQQATDVGRLLDTGAESDSLILNIRKQPFSVVLLDEIEKAHSTVLNLLLQLLDEGQLTDSNGKVASFRDAVIIVTSNAGSADILKQVAAHKSLEGFERPLVDHLIANGTFRAELINRFDEVVLFSPLGKAELKQVAQLMLKSVSQNLTKQNITVALTDAAIDVLVEQGYDPQFGARPMRRVIQRTVEDALARKILSGEISSGSAVTLDVADITNMPTSTD